MIDKHLNLNEKTKDKNFLWKQDNTLRLVLHSRIKHTWSFLKNLINNAESDIFFPIYKILTQTEKVLKW